MSKIDINIIRAATLKDKTAEKELFLQTATYIFHLCRRYSVDDHEAQDYMQEVYLHMYKKLPKFDSNKASFVPWLNRLAINRIIDIKRKKRVFSELTIQDAPITETTEASFLDNISRDDLLKAINQLPDGYRSVVNLLIFEKWSHAEIAKKLDIAESTSRSQYSRSKKLLKQILLKSLPKNYEGILA